MHDDRRLVLSRTTITILSLVVALPLASWPWLYFPPEHGVARFLYQFGIDTLVTRFAASPAVLLVLVVFETLFRWNRLPPRYFWPWFSFFLLPGLVIASLITGGLLVSGWTSFPAGWSIAVLLFFQFVGHTSLLANAAIIDLHD